MEAIRPDRGYFDLSPAGNVELGEKDTTVFKPDGRYIGYCGLYPNFGADGPIEGEAALGFTLAREYWGRGLATEAGRAFVAWGFNDWHVTRIVATVQAGNAGSVRVLE